MIMSISDSGTFKCKKNYAISFKKHGIYSLSKAACGAKCASHLFGVFLLFTVNIEKVI